MLLRRRSSEGFPMRLFTALAGSQRVVTINNPEEALQALSVLLGGMDPLTIRAATADEAMAWNASAMEVGETMQQPSRA
jgi:hypothetical protein